MLKATIIHFVVQRKGGNYLFNVFNVYFICVKRCNFIAMKKYQKSDFLPEKCV